MSTLLLVSLYEFKQFLQIVLWIAIPGTVIAIFLTTFLHYRRKKNQQEAEPELVEQARLLMSGGDMGQLPAFATVSADEPDWLASGNPDNTSLLKKYEREIRRYKENYGILEQDFKALEEKYGDLLNKAYHNDQSGNEAVDNLHQEIKGYKLKIAQLQQAIDFRNEANDPENNSGQDPMELHNLRIALEKVQEENTHLTNKMEEQQYLHDLLEEKKKQTDFLQQQLELRIKNYHQLEKQAGNNSSELEQLRNASEEYNRKEQALQEELQQKQEALHEKTGHSERLESEMAELKEQLAAMHILVSDRQDATRELEKIVEREQQKIKELESKLELSNQIFVRIYSELEKSMDAGVVHSTNGATSSVMGQTPIAN
mgnify:CR=1 FL=1